VILRGVDAGLTCSECGGGVRTVPMARARKELEKMLDRQSSATATCRHCGAVQMRNGFDTLPAFTCQECGLGTK
jgi:hypothetical protein